jgi:hypothetical protein
MALNLLRNSRVFFTTDLDSSGKVDTAAVMTAATTREIQVLDGFSFSQNTGQETVTVNEAGIAPVRGQRSFNTSLEPVDWSFTTYMRPVIGEGATVTAGIDADDVVDCEESVLWGAMSSVTGNGWSQTAGTVVGGAYSVKPVSTAAFTNSNAHQLQKFGLIIVFDDVTFVIDNCAIDSATIDFGIDAIAAIQWNGKGTEMRQLANTVLIGTATGTPATVALTGGITGAGAVAKAKDTNARFIANKLSTMTLASSTFGGLTGTNYTIALTGGNLTISNNLTYLTPANLGVVNRPITYFTGTRSVTSNVTAYLKTGNSVTTTYAQGAGLLKDLLAASSTSAENKFAVNISLGGASNDTRVDLIMPTVQLTIPSITSEQIISTSITMTAQGSSTGLAGGTYDLEKTNEMQVKYYAAV